MSNLTPQTSSGPADDFAAESITTTERTQTQMVLRRFRRHKLAMASIVALILLLAFAFIGPLLWEWDYRLHPGEVPYGEGPSADHPFGTTRESEDMMALVMRGMQQSLKIGLIVMVLDVVIGGIWGAVAGLLRGWVDAVMMRIVDIIFVVPFLVVVASISSGIQGGINWFQIALVIGLLGWGTTARLVRAQVLSLREQEFIEAARAAGASNTRIVFRHLLPNVTGILMVSATLAIVVAILTESGLSFIGFGIQFPDTSLGTQVAEGARAAQIKPWLFYYPGFALVAICLCFNFIGDGLRDAFDPRQTLERK